MGPGEPVFSLKLREANEESIGNYIFVYTRRAGGMTGGGLAVTAKAFDVKQMERDILEAIHTLGNGDIGYFNGSFSPASQVLFEKYGNDDDRLTVVIDYLVEERYLFPLYEDTGKILGGGYARGITPKGYCRLQELQHPIRTWVGANWFAVTVAVITATIGIASVVVNLIINSD